MSRPRTWKPDRDAAVDAVIFRAGTCTALARVVGTSVSVVARWKHIPLKHVATIERVYGIPVHQLRPDHYPNPEAVSIERQIAAVEGWIAGLVDHADPVTKAAVLGTLRAHAA